MISTQSLFLKSKMIATCRKADTFPNEMRMKKAIFAISIKRNVTQNPTLTKIALIKKKEAMTALRN